MILFLTGMFTRIIVSWSWPVRIRRTWTPGRRLSSELEFIPKGSRWDFSSCTCFSCTHTAVSYKLETSSRLLWCLSGACFAVVKSLLWLWVCPLSMFSSMLFDIKGEGRKGTFPWNAEFDLTLKIWLERLIMWYVEQKEAGISVNLKTTVFLYLTFEFKSLWGKKIVGF